MTRSPRAAMSLSFALLTAVALPAQQMPDRSFRPMIEDRAYAIGTGPVVCFDERHNNVHTLNDGFWPFADLVRRDGYLVRPITTTFDEPSIADCRTLVITSPRLPIAEADPLRKWVAGGGSLLLIADRGSIAGTSDLAAAFGLTFTDTTAATPTSFRSLDKTLQPHAIVRGRHAKESVASVTTFASILMRAPPPAEQLLVSRDGAVQGAVMRVGMGRAAFFGDAALFTAQITSPERRRVGMSARGAEQNFQFVLNVMHWLSGVI